MNGQRTEIAGRALRYSVNAVCAMEEKCPSLDELFDKPYAAARLLLWGALIGGDDNMTVEDAGRLIDEYLLGGGTIEEIVAKCTSALEAAGMLRRKDA